MNWDETVRLRIISLMDEKGIKQCDFVQFKKQKMSHIVNGRVNVSISDLASICDTLSISLSDFFSPFCSSSNYASVLFDSNNLTSEELEIIKSIAARFRELHPKTHEARARIAGAAAAGRPLCDEADEDASVAVPRKYCDSSRYLIFQARGDSMDPRIPDGSYVVIQRDTPPNDGDIAVVRVASAGDDEYAIKRFYRRGDRVELRSINPAYSPMVYAASDVQSANRVVAFLPAPSSR